MRLALVLLLAGCADVLHLDHFDRPDAAGPVSIALVQHSAGADTTNTVMSYSRQFGKPLVSGDLAVVITSWVHNDIASVTDTAGNTYTRAGPPGTVAMISQALYYAENVSPSDSKIDEVTVTFTGPAMAIDLRLLEYEGIVTTGAFDNANELDGTSNMPSVDISTTHGPDLIVAGTAVSGFSDMAGQDFELRDVVQGTGSLSEDRVALTPGGYTASSHQHIATGMGLFVMQVAAFKGQ